MYYGIERRKHKRIEKQYLTRFKIKVDETRDTDFEGWDSVVLKNVCAGGALLFCNEDLGIGTLLDLKIYVHKAIRIINCVGKIVRIDKTQPDSMYCCAIKFIDIGEQEKEIINTTVAEVLG